MRIISHRKKPSKYKSEREKTHDDAIATIVDTLRKNGRIIVDDEKILSYKYGFEPDFIMEDEDEIFVFEVKIQHPDRSPQRTVNAVVGMLRLADYKLKDHFRHSKDFRSVTLYGEQFELTFGQAQVVELLYEAKAKGTPSLGQAYIMAETDGQRLRDTFRSNLGAYEKLIRPGAKRGTYRLNI